MDKNNIDDFRTLSNLKKMDEHLKTVEDIKSGRIDAEGLMEYNGSFFTGYDDNKMAKFNRLKEICYTAEKSSRFGKVKVLEVQEPNNTNHNPFVILLVPAPSFFCGSQLDVVKDMIDCSDSFAFATLKGKVVRITFGVQGVFYDEKVKK